MISMKRLISIRHFSQRYMKAIVCDGQGGPEVLKVSDKVPIPSCKEGEVLVKVEATAVNRADTLQRKGKYPPPKGASEIIGLECIGQIVDKDSLEKISEQRVMALLPGGGYAQYVNVRFDHLVKAPENLALEQLAAIPEVWMTAFQLLNLVANVQPGETALILAAASGVGTSLIQLCKRQGVKSIAVASSIEKLNACLKYGADHVISYKEHPDYSTLVKEFTQGKGVNAILDPILASNFNYNINSLSMDARWVMYGTMGGLKVTPEANFTKLIQTRSSIIASTLRNRSDSYKDHLVQRFRDEMLPGFEDGSLLPVVDRVFKLSEVAEAHAHVESNANIGKVVMLNDLW